MNGFFFLDVDTQRDFMLPTGALYVPGAERIIPRLRRLFEFAQKNGIFVLSSADAHERDDPEFMDFPPHCIVGTEGQKKLSETVFHRHLVLENAPADRNFLETVRKFPQVIVQKQAFDLFTNPVSARIVRALPERVIVFGVATEYCVRSAVLGLRRLGLKTAVLSDAIGSIDEHAGQGALREMQSSGAEVTTLESLLAAYAG